MKEYLNKTYIIKCSRLLMMTFLLAVCNTVYAQTLTCNGTANIPRSGTSTVNGVAITSSYTGSVSTFTSSYPVCSGQTMSANSLWAGQTGLWSLTLIFNKPVNNVVLLLAATGTGGNENFIFNSNGGVVSIYSDSPSNCFSTISGNEIISGAGAGSSGGGGIFRVSVPNNFTSLTINGAGGYNGSLMAFCSSSIVAAPPTISSIAPAMQSVCQDVTPSAITVTATGTGTLSYQWYKNAANSNTGGTLITGATLASYTPPATSASGPSYYYAVVSDSNGSALSPVATVNVTAGPSTPLVSANTLSNACPTTTADLTTLQPAAVSGQTYEWHIVATNPNSGTLVANPNTVSVSGNYYLYAKANSGGCYSTASNAVAVTITPCTPPPTCTTTGATSVNLNLKFTGTTPGTAVQLQWWKTANRAPGTQEMNPTNVTQSGTYYAFFYDTANNCYNTGLSTSSVTVTILPPCSCTQPGSFPSPSTSNPTKTGITIQEKKAGWPENINNGFLALESKTKGFVITRVATVGDNTDGTPTPLDSVTDPKEGMIVYDIADSCVKLFTNGKWKCIEKSCNN